MDEAELDAILADEFDSQGELKAPGTTWQSAWLEEVEEALDPAVYLPQATGSERTVEMGQQRDVGECAPHGTSSEEEESATSVVGWASNEQTVQGTVEHLEGVSTHQDPICDKPEAMDELSEATREELNMFSTNLTNQLSTLKDSLTEDAIISPSDDDDHIDSSTTVSITAMEVQNLIVEIEGIAITTTNEKDTVDPDIGGILHDDISVRLSQHANIPMNLVKNTVAGVYSSLMMSYKDPGQADPNNIIDDSEDQSASSANEDSSDAILLIEKFLQQLPTSETELPNAAHLLYHDSEQDNHYGPGYQHQSDSMDGSENPSCDTKLLSSMDDFEEERFNHSITDLSQLQTPSAQTDEIILNVVETQNRIEEHMESNVAVYQLLDTVNNNDCNGTSSKDVDEYLDEQRDLLRVLSLSSKSGESLTGYPGKEPVTTLNQTENAFEDEVFPEAEEIKGDDAMSTRPETPPKQLDLVSTQQNGCSQNESDQVSCTAILSKESNTGIRRTFEHVHVAEVKPEAMYLKVRRRHQAIARECARRMTFSVNTHASRMPPQEDIEFTKELDSVKFNNNWRSLFAAFRVGEMEEFIKCGQADEDINAYLYGRHVVDAQLIRDFFKLVLEGAQASSIVRRVIRNPPEQQDPDITRRIPGHAIGRCLKAVPTVFTSLLSAQMDIYSERRRGEPLLEEDWIRLKNTARDYVADLIELALQFLFDRYPALAHMNVINQQGSITPSNLFVRDCLLNSMACLFNKGLWMFYEQVFNDADQAIHERCKSLSPKTLLDIAVEYGLSPRSKAIARFTTNNSPKIEEEIVRCFTAFMTTNDGPLTRLNIFLDACRVLTGGTEHSGSAIGGDDILPLLIAAITLASNRLSENDKRVRLASIANILDDFALPDEYKSGEGGFASSLLLVAAEVLMAKLDQ